MESADIKDFDISVRHAFDDLMEDFNEAYEETSLLMARIDQSTVYSQTEKEKFYNETLVEFEEKSKRLLDTYIINNEPVQTFEWQ